MCNAIYIDSYFQNVNLRHDVIRHTVNYRMLKMMRSSHMFFNYLSITSVRAQLSRRAFGLHAYVPERFCLPAYVPALLSCTLKSRHPVWKHLWRMFNSCQPALQWTFFPGIFVP